MIPTGLKLLAPTLSLSAFAFILFGLDTVRARTSEKTRSVAFGLTLLGLVVSALLIPCSVLRTPTSYGHGMLIADGLSFVMSWIALSATFIVVVMSQQDRSFEGVPLSAY